MLANKLCELLSLRSSTVQVLTQEIWRINPWLLPGFTVQHVSQAAMKSHHSGVPPYKCLECFPVTGVEWCFSSGTKGAAAYIADLTCVQILCACRKTVATHSCSRPHMCTDIVCVQETVAIHSCSRHPISTDIYMCAGKLLPHIVVGDVTSAQIFTCVQKNGCHA